VVYDNGYRLCSGSSRRECQGNGIGQWSGVTACTHGCVNDYGCTPYLSYVHITPVSPTVRDDLTCVVSGLADDDGDSVWATYRWFRNGSLIEDENSQTLPYTQLQIGDYVKCEATPWDALQSGLPLNSTQVKILEYSKGTVPMNNGTPFYTIDSNPYYCGNLTYMQSCLTTWRVNATTNTTEANEFMTYAQTPSGLYDESIIFNVTVVENTTTTLPCEGSHPPTEGDWNVIEYTVCVDESINLSLNSWIIINNSQTLLLNNTFVNQYNSSILFEGGGILDLWNSTIVFE
jgi:hypothetical protein